MECHSLGMFDNKKAGAPLNIIPGCLDWSNTNLQVRWFILINTTNKLDQPTIFLMKAFQFVAFVLQAYVIRESWLS